MKKWKLTNENGEEFTVSSLEEIEKIIEGEGYKDIADKLFMNKESYFCDIRGNVS